MTDASDSGRDAGDSGSGHSLELSRGRVYTVRALVGVATLLLIVAIFATYANRLLFSPDNWSNTSTQLLQNPQIRSTTANYIVDQIYANVNVAALISSGLPKQLQPLAAPAAGALHEPAVQTVDAALSRPRVQELWAKANRAAAESFIAVVKGRKGSVKVQNGVVTLDLGSLIDSMASRLGLPSNLSSKLPPQAANLTIFKSDQLRYVQKGGNLLQKLAVWLLVIVPVLFALALLLARGRRRRTLMNIGFAGVFAGLIAVLGRHVLETQVASSLTHDASLKATITEVVTIATSLLGEVATAVIAIGVVFVVAAWFAGPARIARLTREAIAPTLREHPVRTYAVTVGVLLLVFLWNPIPATGKPAGIIVFTVLALLGTEVLRRQTAEEFPHARSGAATAAIRARLRRQPKPQPPSAQETVADQLNQLADLHKSGALDGEEYESAKRKLLQT